MQDISNVANYAEILLGDYSVQWAIDIGESGRLINEEGDYISFSRPGSIDPSRIILGSAGADNGYGEELLKSISITNAMFSGTPVLGKAVSAEIDVEMLMPIAKIPRMAAVRAFSRIFNDSLVSGWIPQGTFYIDTREIVKDQSGEQKVLRFHGFDCMLMTEQAYIWNLSAPARDIDVVRDICAQLEFDVDDRTVQIMTANYQVLTEQIGQYTMREVLSYLAGSYAGSFIITPQNQLRLVQLVTPPGETNYLATVEGGVYYSILFGNDRITV